MGDRTLSGRMLILVAGTFLMAGCATTGLPGSGKAPEPTKPVDAARFFNGTWLEVARRPMWITDGCVAGTTSYTPSPDGTIAVKDACRKGTPAGEEKAITGTGTIENPGQNTKLHVQYAPLLSRDYWIIDRADDYSWFIEASPDFGDLYIFTRRVPNKAQLDRLVARAKALGYDTSRLEFPPQPPR